MNRIPFVKNTKLSSTISGSYSWGERCCKDCSKGNDPAKWEKWRGTAVLDASGEIYTGVNAEPKPYNLVIKGYGFRGSYKFVTGFSADISVRPQAGIFAERIAEPCEEGGCAAIQVGVDASIKLKATLIDADVNAEIVSGGKPEELLGIGVTAKGSARVGKSGGSLVIPMIDGGSCPAGAGTWFIGAGTIEAKINATLKVIGLKVFDPEFTYIYELWQPLSGNDSGDQ